MQPSPTCIDILRCNSSASSGYYQIQAANGSNVQVYCDMEGTNCGGEGGWMRVTHLNMADTSNHCPDDFLLKTINSKRFCIRDTAKMYSDVVLFQQIHIDLSTHKCVDLPEDTNKEHQTRL